MKRGGKDTVLKRVQGMGEGQVLGLHDPVYDYQEFSNGYFLSPEAKG